MAKSIKFEVVDFSDDGFHWLAECEINGAKYHLVIDTGASRTVIDKNILNDTDFKQHPNSLVLGFNSQSESICTASIEEFSIGGIILKDQLVAVSDLSQLSNTYYEISGVKLAGILGCDFIMNYVSSINVGRHRIYLKNKYR